MTRIIAGWAGSLALVVPAHGTRPTSDRVREAIFSALDARDALEGSRVLDLYSGSGALGLEAASRGAAQVTLVDRNIQASMRNAARVLEQAPPAVRSTLTIETSAQSVRAFLTSARAVWDLVFVDPPYELTLPELGHTLEALSPRLSAGATVVLERSSRSPEPSWPEGIELERRKDYGDTALFWLRAAGHP
ncbi:MAG: RsmD family RNA methyltransferase [Rhodoglobus sp.]